MSYYETLRDKVKMECEIQDFKEVNDCINGILPNEYEDKIKIDIIKSLICHFEGKLNKANSYTIMTISYALLISAIAIAGIILQDTMVLLVILFVVAGFAIFAVAKISMNVRRSDNKDAFILKALNFKLDELNKKNESSIVTGTTNETDLSNQVNTMNDPDETRDYREYVVRVYNDVGVKTA